MGVGEAEDGEAVLSQAIAIEDDEAMKTIIQGVATGKPIEALIPLLDDVAHAEGQCSATFNLLQHAKATNASQSVAELSAKMTLLDPDLCKRTLALATHMKAQGTWD